MSYRITTYSALQANLSAAGTTLGLSRAALGRLPLSDTERAETIERLRKQIGELEAMILELEGPGGRPRRSPLHLTYRSDVLFVPCPGGARASSSLASPDLTGAMRFAGSFFFSPGKLSMTNLQNCEMM